MLIFNKSKGEIANNYEFQRNIVTKKHCFILQSMVNLLFDRIFIYLRSLYIYRIVLEISVEILIALGGIRVSGVNYESSVDGIGEREWNRVVVKFIASL